MSEIKCCETYGGDEIDNSYRMLFGHHPFCPLLKEIPNLMSKKQFEASLNEFYRFWKKTELDKIRNEFYANPPVLSDTPKLFEKETEVM